MLTRLIVITMVLLGCGCGSRSSNRQYLVKCQGARHFREVKFFYSDHLGVIVRELDGAIIEYPIGTPCVLQMIHKYGGDRDMKSSTVSAIAVGYALGALRALTEGSRTGKAVPVSDLEDIVKHLEWLLYVQLPGDGSGDRD